jgi:hypothetical protein
MDHTRSSESQKRANSYYFLGKASVRIGAIAIASSGLPLAVGVLRPLERSRSISLYAGVRGDCFALLRDH